MPPKADLAVVLAGKAKPEEDAYAEDLEMVGEDLIAAVKKGDAAKAAEALKAAHTICSRADEE